MKIIHRTMERYLVEETEIGQEFTSDEAVDILKKKRGQVDNGRRSKRNRHMAFVPTIQGMGYILRISVHFKKSENTIRKKTVWRRVV